MIDSSLTLLTVNVLVWLLAFGATARVTRFLNDDVLAEPIRSWVSARFGEDSRLAYLIECPWCASIWLAAPAATVAWFAVPESLRVGAWWYTIPGLWLTISYAYGRIASED